MASKLRNLAPVLASLVVLIVPLVFFLRVATSQPAPPQPLDPGFHAGAQGLSPSARAGREIWFKSTAGNARFHTYVFQQRLGVMIDWFRVLRSEARGDRFAVGPVGSVGGDVHRVLGAYQRGEAGEAYPVPTGRARRLGNRHRAPRPVVGVDGIGLGGTGCRRLRHEVAVGPTFPGQRYRGRLLHRGRLEGGSVVLTAGRRQRGGEEQQTEHSAGTHVGGLPGDGWTGSHP